MGAGPGSRRPRAPQRPPSGPQAARTPRRQRGGPRSPLFVWGREGRGLGAGGRGGWGGIKCSIPIRFFKDTPRPLATPTLHGKHRHLLPAGCGARQTETSSWAKPQRNSGKMNFLAENSEEKIRDKNSGTKIRGRTSQALRERPTGLAPHDLGPRGGRARGTAASPTTPRPPPPPPPTNSTSSASARTRRGRARRAAPPTAMPETTTTKTHGRGRTRPRPLSALSIAFEARSCIRRRLRRANNCDNA